MKIEHYRALLAAKDSAAAAVEKPRSVCRFRNGARHDQSDRSGGQVLEVKIELMEKSGYIWQLHEMPGQFAKISPDTSQLHPLRSLLSQLEELLRQEFERL